MSVLLWILLTSVIGGTLSVLTAAFFAFSARASWVPLLVSYAIGALLGAVFLEILPHAMELAPNIHGLTGTILLGILAFFILEKLVLWRHCHTDACEAHGMDSHGHDYGRSGMMIMIGDTFHNFVDGVIIAGAFLVDVQLGIVTGVAIIAHEIPQEVGDFVILLHSGYSRRRALLFNLASSLAMAVGGILAYFALQALHGWIAYLLGVAAASMIYVSVADLIPGLHRRAALKATVEQVALIGLGIASIWLTGTLFGE